MNIPAYIHSLLYYHDCVIIPDFGGFISAYRPAGMKRNNHLMSPPSKDIGFNKSLKNNDGILAKHISEAEKISFNEALTAIADFTKDIESKLARGEKIWLNGLGNLYQDAEAKIHFENTGTTNFMLDSFGLTNIHVHELPQEKGSFLKKALNLEEEEEPARNIPYEYIGKALRNKNTRKVLFSIPIVVALIMIPLNPRIGSEIKTDRAGILPGPSSHNQPTEEVVKQTNKPEPKDEFRFEKTDSKSVANSTIEKPAEKPKKISTPKNIHIVAGSFKSSQNASFLKNKLIQRGYPAHIISTSNGYSRVILKSFAELSQAEKEFSMIRNRENDLKIWLLK